MIQRQQGFTLLELVVAVAIVAVMFTFATFALTTTLTGNEVAEKEAKRLGELQKAMLIISRDLTQAVNRPVRDAFGSEVEAMRGGSLGSVLLELTRSGRSNPEPDKWDRSHLQRVGYLLDEEKVVRFSWSVLDLAEDVEPSTVVLIENVAELEVRFLDNQQQWQEYWPLPSSGDPDAPEQALPLAIELNIELDDWGKITRLFAVAGAGS